MAENRHKTELKGKDKFLAGFSSFLEKNKVVLLVILAVIAVIIIAIAVIDSVNEKKANVSAENLESIQDNYQKWVSDSEDIDKDELEALIIEDADIVIEENGSAFAAQRAYFIKANVSFQKENWAEAADFYIKSSDLNRDSYLAPISLMHAASSYENDSKYSEALGIYKDIYADYDKIFPDIPRVMLSIGRLNEQTGDISAAKDSYNEMIDKYPGSGWTSFARTRLIHLEN